MKLYSIDKREIRSFRLRQKTLDIKQFFENTNSFGLFMMTDTFQPKDRIANRNTFIQHKLKVINLSKKIVNFLTANNSMKPLQHLLKGNVVLFRNKDNAPILNINALTFLLTDKNLSPRFLYWNKNIYLKSDIIKLIDNSQNKKNLNQLSLLIKNISLTQLRINPFIKYNKPNQRLLQALIDR